MEKIKVENMSEYYLTKSVEDSKAADILYDKGFISQALYLQCQSVEKKIKSELYKKINPLNRHYHKLSDTHSLKDLMEFLLEITVTDENQKEQMKNQIKDMLRKMNYSRLNNRLRYPVYDKNYEQYIESCYDRNDYKEIVKNRFEPLKRYVESLFKA